MQIAFSCRWASIFRNINHSHIVPKEGFVFPIHCPSSSTETLLGDNNSPLFRASVETAGVGSLFVGRDVAKDQ